LHPVGAVDAYATAWIDIREQFGGHRVDVDFVPDEFFDVGQ